MISIRRATELTNDPTSDLLPLLPLDAPVTKATLFVLLFMASPSNRKGLTGHLF